MNFIENQIERLFHDMRGLLSNYESNIKQLLSSTEKTEVKENFLSQIFENLFKTKIQMQENFAKNSNTNSSHNLKNQVNSLKPKKNFGKNIFNKSLNLLSKSTQTKQTLLQKAQIIFEKEYKVKNLKTPSLLYEPSSSKFTLQKIQAKVENVKGNQLHLKIPKDFSTEKKFFISSSEGIYTIEVLNFEKQTIRKRKILKESQIQRFLLYNENRLFLLKKSTFSGDKTTIIDFDITTNTSKEIFSGDIVTGLRGSMFILKISSNSQFLMTRHEETGILIFDISCKEINVEEILFDIVMKTNTSNISNSILNFFEIDQNLVIVTYYGEIIFRPFFYDKKVISPLELKTKKIFVKEILERNGKKYENDVKVLAAQYNPDFKLLCLAVTDSVKERRFLLQVFKLKKKFEFEFLGERVINFYVQPGIEIEIIVEFTVWGFPLIFIHLAGNRFLHSYILRDNEITLFGTPLLFSVAKMAQLIIKDNSIWTFNGHDLIKIDIIKK